MADAVIEDIADFRKPEDLEDPERSELSGAPEVQVRGSQFRDDVAGAALPLELVTAARAEEIRFMESWGVWGIRLVSERLARAGKTHRWA
eukprot:14439216-Alexandrium_andersonii.AAC.1